MSGYSVFGTSLDGTDKNVRLDAYMADEKGGKDGWKIERCYIKEREMIEIMAGDFFICYAPISSEKFLSLPPDLEKKYVEKFRYPETFVRTNDGIKAIPYKPKTKDFEAINRKIRGSRTGLRYLSEQTIYGQECPKRYTR